MSTERETEDTPPPNAAPDAVKDPNAKTEGKPGLNPDGGAQKDETDPGGG